MALSDWWGGSGSDDSGGDSDDDGGSDDRGMGGGMSDPGGVPGGGTAGSGTSDGDGDGGGSDDRGMGGGMSDPGGVPGGGTAGSGDGGGADGGGSAGPSTDVGEPDEPSLPSTPTGDDDGDGGGQAGPDTDVGEPDEPTFEETPTQDTGDGMTVAERVARDEQRQGQEAQTFTPTPADDVTPRRRRARRRAVIDAVIRREEVAGFDADTDVERLLPGGFRATFETDEGERRTRTFAFDEPAGVALRLRQRAETVRSFRDEVEQETGLDAGEDFFTRFEDGGRRLMADLSRAGRQELAREATAAREQGVAAGAGARELERVSPGTRARGVGVGAGETELGRRMVVQPGRGLDAGDLERRLERAAEQQLERRAAERAGVVNPALRRGIDRDVDLDRGVDFRLEREGRRVSATLTPTGQRHLLERDLRARGISLEEATVVREGDRLIARFERTPIEREDREPRERFGDLPIIIGGEIVGGPAPAQRRVKEGTGVRLEDFLSETLGGPIADGTEAIATRIEEADEFPGMQALRLGAPVPGATPAPDTLEEESQLERDTRTVAAELVRLGGTFANVPRTLAGLKEAGEFVGFGVSETLQGRGGRIDPQVPVNLENIEIQPSLPTQPMSIAPAAARRTTNLEPTRVRTTGPLVGEVDLAEGGFAGAAEEAGVEAVEGVVEFARENPLRFGTQLAGSLLISAAAIRGASRISPRAGRATAYAIQPGEELVGSAGFRATRATLGRRAADVAFPHQEPIFMSEEFGIRTARRAGGALRRGAGRARRAVGRRPTRVGAGLGGVELELETEGETEAEAETEPDTRPKPLERDRPPVRPRSEEVPSRSAFERRRRRRLMEEAGRRELGPMARRLREEAGVTSRALELEAGETEAERRLERAQEAEVEASDEGPARMSRVEPNLLEQALERQQQAQQATVTTETISGVRATPGIDVISRPELETELTQELDTETEVETELETELETEFETEVETEAEAEAELETEVEQELEVELELEAEAETELEVEGEPLLQRRRRREEFRRPTGEFIRRFEAPVATPEDVFKGRLDPGRIDAVPDGNGGGSGGGSPDGFKALEDDLGGGLE